MKQLFLIGHDLKQEEAWNYGLSASLNLPIADKQLELNAEYYYTDFRHQMVVNIDGAAKHLPTTTPTHSPKLATKLPSSNNTFALNRQ